ncbi:MAG: GntR family transcriptional regulator [Trueperaceae bacterium]|nr:GntR family transcriptional regulator [Trueperaceae bacterium]
MPVVAEPRLSKDADLPLYVQLYGILRGQVVSGELVPGDLIPAESELVATYGVSRITVRAALDQLVHDGLIDRQRGRGSYVKAPAVPDARACMVSFTDQMLGAGREPGTRIAGVARGLAADLDLTASPFDPDEPLVRIDRVRLVDGEPAAVMRSYLPDRRVPGLSATTFAERGPQQSLLFVLERRYGLALDQGEETMAPGTIAEPFAALLGIAPGSAVVVKTCVVRDVSGVATLYEASYWNAPQTQLVRRVASLA